MVSKTDEKYAIYPLYFEKKLSRIQGRKVSKKNAIEKPQLENIAKAAKSLHLNPVIEKDCSHPSRPFKHDGRVLVDKKDGKSKLLLQIANRM